MAGRVLIDSSALVALAHPRDQWHAEAVRIARGFKAAGGRWLCTVLVLAEFHNLALRSRGRGEARQHLERLLSDTVYEWVPVTTDLVGAAVTNWMVRYSDQDFSLFDAVSFEVMRRERISEAFAFDQDFVTAGFRLLG